MGRQGRAEATRVAVLTAAAEIFLSDGYADATLGEILERAAVTKGALYFHFASKEELARAVIAEGHARVVAASAPVRSTSAPGVEALIGLCQLVLALTEEDPVVAAMQRLYREIGDFRGADGNVVAAWHDLVGELVARADGAGDLVADDPAEVTVLVVGALMGIWLAAEATGAVKELPRRVERFWYHLLPSLVAPAQVSYFRQYAQRRLLR